MGRIPALFIGVILCATTAAPAAGAVPPGNDRLPVPNEAEQGKSLALVRDLYKEQFDRAATKSQKSTLANKLVDEAMATKQDASGQYVLFTVAKRIAVQVGDVDTAFHAIDGIAAHFQVDAWALKSDALHSLAESTKSKVEWQTLAAAALHAVDSSIDTDDYAMAKQLIDFASDAARKARDGKLIRRITEKGEEVEGAVEAHRAFQGALATLRQNPNDAEANLKAGSYYCFHKQDWTKGIPFLARGNEPVLKAIAEDELKGADSPDRMADIADRWYEFVSQVPGTDKQAVLDRATHWYEKALPRLSGLTKQKVEKRLEEIHQLTEDASSADAIRQVFAGPKRTIAVDAHKGETGHFSEKNIYVLAGPQPVALDKTAVFYQANGAAGNDTSGIISFSPDGDTWIAIGLWTPEEIASGSRRQNWHRVGFSNLDRDIRTRRIFVKFEYTSGKEKLVLSRVLWSYEGK